MTDFPAYTADGDPVRPRHACRHHYPTGECPMCDALKPAPANWRELVKTHLDSEDES